MLACVIPHIIHASIYVENAESDSAGRIQYYAESDSAVFCGVLDSARRIGYVRVNIRCASRVNVSVNCSSTVTVWWYAVVM